MYVLGLKAFYCLRMNYFSLKLLMKYNQIHVLEVKQDKYFVNGISPKQGTYRVLSLQLIFLRKIANKYHH